MYIVRDKATRKILHVNPAPVAQGLQGSDIYHRLDAATMEVARGELAEVPEYFDVDEQGTIVPWTLERQVREGHKALPPDVKAVGDRIVAKTLADKVADGTVKLEPTEKLVGDHIVPKTPAEQVADGLLELTRTQVVDGDDIREMTDAEKIAAGLMALDPHLKVVGKEVVSKTLEELVRDKLLELGPDEKIQGDDVIKLTPREMLEDKRIDLRGYKQAVIERFVEVSMAERRKQLPDHQLLYAAIGVLDTATTESYRKIAADHARLLDDKARAISVAATADAVDAVAGLGEWPKMPVLHVDNLSVAR